MAFKQSGEQSGGIKIHHGEPFTSCFEGMTIHAALCDAASKYSNKDPIIEDAQGNKANYKRVLIGTRVLANKFSSFGNPGDSVAILLPNVTAVLVTILAVQSAGFVPAMLNYTAGPATVVSACRTTKVSQIIASRAFVEKAELERTVEALEVAGLTIHWLEDIGASVNWFDKIKAALSSRKVLSPRKPDDPAVILFTSGSEGEPKGVVLSHNNILSNCSQVTQAVAFIPEEKIFNVLPVFHSFGITAGLFIPIMFGIPLYLYPSPLHYKIIPKAAAEVKPTILFGTDTFLTGYARTAKDTDFSSIRLVVAGAEAVKAETRRIWRERFGTQILEGFGMTEASPVVAVNRVENIRDGTVGQMMNGMEAKLEPVDGISEGGQLWVRGPNVMLGYMIADHPGELQPLGNGGWHDTGDIVTIDEEGLISIRGRVKRFAKIAGEMVSLGAIEILVQNLWPEESHAVVSVPDKRKGERLVLVTTSNDAETKIIQTETRDAGLSEITVPKDIVNVDEIPVLGSGKTDYVSTRKVAMNQLGLDEAA